MSEPLQPPPPPPGDAPSGQPIPWEDRERLGFLKAFVENIRLFVTSPTEGFERARRQGDLTSPLAFAVLISWAGAIVQALWQFAFGWTFLPFLSQMGEGGGALHFAGTSFGLVVQMIVAPIFALIGLFLISGILHVALLLFGGLGESTTGFEGTIRAVSYGAVAQLASLVPFVGGMLALVWALVLYTIGLATVHRTSQGKALAAVLVPVALCCLCLVLVGFFVVGSLAALFAAGSH